MLEPNGKFKYIQIIWIQFNTSTKSTNACCLNIFKSEVGMVQQTSTSLNTHTAQPATVWTHPFGPTMSHAFSKFSLQMDAPKPYLVLLALKIASSSSWHSTWNMVKHAWNIVKLRCGGWDTFSAERLKASWLMSSPSELIHPQSAQFQLNGLVGHHWHHWAKLLLIHEPCALGPHCATLDLHTLDWNDNKIRFKCQIDINFSK